MKIRWLIVSLFALGAVYFALFGGEYGYFDVRRIEKQRAEEQATLAELRAHNRQLKARADSLEKDPATLERVAREKYGLIKPGERLYRFIDSTAPHPDSADTTARR